jgi:hypothetical protein
MNQAGQLDKAAAEMIAGAQKALITGLVAAGVQFLAAGVSVIGSVKSLKGMSAAQIDTKQALKEGTKLTKDAVDDMAKAAAQQMTDQAMKVAGQAFMKAQGVGNVFSAIGQMGTAVGQGTSAYGSSEDTKAQAAAKKMEAQGSRDAAEAQELQQAADNKKQIEEALNDMMKQIINFLKELREAEVDAMRSLTKV